MTNIGDDETHFFNEEVQRKNKTPHASQVPPTQVSNQELNEEKIRNQSETKQVQITTSRDRFHEFRSNKSTQFSWSITDALSCRM